jgi:serine/threonine-protein kinase RsbW
MNETASLRIAATVENLARMRSFVGEAATCMGAGSECTADMVLAMDEAATNIMVHGYCGKPGWIEIEVAYSNKALMVTLRDRAPHFDPRLVPEPAIDLPLEQRPLGGLGVYIMRCLTDELRYRVTADGKNELTLVKKDLSKL